jgi:hypothetical protein
MSWPLNYSPFVAVTLQACKIAPPIESYLVSPWRSVSCAHLEINILASAVLVLGSVRASNHHPGGPNSQRLRMLKIESSVFICLVGGQRLNYTPAAVPDARAATTVPAPNLGSLSTTRVISIELDLDLEISIKVQGSRFQILALNTLGGDPECIPETCFRTKQSNTNLMGQRATAKYYPAK